MADANLSIEVTTKGAKQSTDELKKLEKQSGKTENATDDLSKSAKGSEPSFKKMGGAVSAVIKPIAIMVTTATAAAAAVTAVAVSSANAYREMSILANQAQVTVDEMQALAFATETVGVNAEQLGDISKDISDKLGEFGAAGTGAFQDFADVVGLSTEAAVAYSKQLAALSPPDAIRQISADLEEAGATTEETTFVLESLGNDLSKLIPLLDDNAAGWDELTGKYKAATDQFSLSAEQADNLGKISEQFDLIKKQGSEATTFLTAEFAPEFLAIMDAIATDVPKVTNVIYEFFDSFRAAENRTSIQGVTDDIAALETKLSSLQKGGAIRGGILGVDVTGAQTASEIKEVTEELEALNKQLIELEAAKAESEKTALTPELTGIVGGAAGAGATGERLSATDSSNVVAETSKREDALKNRAQRELELLKISNQTELEQLNSFYDLDLAEYQKYKDNKALTDAEYNEAKLELDKKLAEDTLAIATQSAEQEKALQSFKLEDASNTFEGLGQLAEIFGGKQSKAAKAAFTAAKAASIAQTTIKTYEAATGAYSSLAGIPIVGPALGATAAGAAIGAGLANVAAIKGTQYSGRLQGGDINDGTPYLVGERGPELIVPRRDASVISNANLPTQAANDAPAQQPVINVINQVDQDNGSWLNSPAGEQVILNIVSNNPEAFKSAQGIS